MSSVRAVKNTVERGDNMSFFENMLDTLIAVLLALVGGLARLLNSKDERGMKFTAILAELFIAGFAGIMVLLLARVFGLEGDWLGLICGIAGWIGPRILDLIAKPAAQKIGIDLDAKEKKD